MCRWLIAIFLLVLVAGTGLFGPAAVGTDEARSHTPVLSALADHPESGPAPMPLSAASDHGLSDTPSDLPEVILALASAPPSGPLAAGPLPLAPHKRPQPTLDGLQRPPSGHAVT